MGGWTESQTRMGSSLFRKGGYYIAIGRADGTYIKRQAFVKIKRGVVSGLKRGMRGGKVMRQSWDVTRVISCFFFFVFEITVWGGGGAGAYFVEFTLILGIGDCLCFWIFLRVDVWVGLDGGFDLPPPSQFYRLLTR